MSTFAERKAERLADSKKAFRWDVIDPIDDTVLASFSDIGKARSFTNKQVGPLLGNTAALGVWQSKHGSIPTSNYQQFYIKRVEL